MDTMKKQRDFHRGALNSPLTSLSYTWHKEKDTPTYIKDLLRPLPIIMNPCLSDPVGLKISPTGMTLKWEYINRGRVFGHWVKKKSNFLSPGKSPEFDINPFRIKHSSPLSYFQSLDLEEVPHSMIYL